MRTNSSCNQVKAEGWPSLGVITSVLLRMVVVALVAHSAMAQSTPAAARHASVQLLARGLKVGPDGQHHVILRALRDLRDPELEPLFDALAAADHPTLRIHGILGLAQIHPDQGLDLKRIASIDNPAVQGELVSAALDADLLQPSAANTMLGWNGLDPGVKMLLIARQIEHGNFDPSTKPILHQAAESPRLGRRALANLLLLQLGESTAAEGLWNLSDGPEANTQTNVAGQSPNAVRTMLLRTVEGHQFHKAAAWAYAVAQAQPSQSSLGMFALRLAMRFGSQQALALWHSRFQQTNDAGLMMRYAMIGLRTAPWLEPEAFGPMAAGDKPLIRAMAKAGRAIAGGSGSSTIADRIVRLIETHHPLLGRWALDYARTQAKGKSRQLILMGLIVSAGEGPEGGRRGRLALASKATRLLYASDPKAGTRLLRPMITNPGTEPRLKRAILRGLVGARAKPTAKLRSALEPIKDLKSNELALLLRARAGGKLSRVDMADLRVLVRGGGGLSTALRTKAAWWYLERSGEADRVRSALVNSMGNSSR